MRKSTFWVVSLVASLLWIGAVVAASQAAPDKDAARLIEKALQKHGADVHRCFEKALADRMDVSGKVEVEVTVGAGGRVTAAKVGKGEAVPEVLSSCVQSVAAAWTMEGIESGAKVVLPFSFQAQNSQFTVKAEDVPERVPGAAASKAKPGPKREAPYTYKVLADEANMRVSAMSLTQLNIGPASRVATHRHPRSAKVLYVLKGHARLLGPTGVDPVKLDEGMAAFVPAGYPHAIENMGRQTTAVVLQAFVPPGPERVYRNPTDARGRADFEVVRDAKDAKAPPEENGVLVVSATATAASAPLAGGKGAGKLLVDPKATHSQSVTVNVLEFANGGELARHDHGRAAEILYVISGSGKLMVGSEEYPVASDQILYLPPGQPHAIKLSPVEKTDKAVALQFLAGGPAAPTVVPPKASGNKPR
jgi:mannose-6-phosphate isomerase-like protein (cupin superfamily)